MAGLVISPASLMWPWAGEFPRPPRELTRPMCQNRRCLATGGVSRPAVSVEEIGVGAQLGAHGRFPKPEEALTVAVGHEVEERLRQR